MTDTNIDGALAAALAAAQASFPAISRDKEVTVQTKTGGSYKFKYAPLDSILNAVRKPLSDNGLALVQLLDDGELVTMLLHKDGAKLAGRVALPNVDGGVQAFGSAITYLRRYSIQAILGIAAEEDDDGNQAAGNNATFTPNRPHADATSSPDDATDGKSKEVEEMMGRVRRRGIIRKGSADNFKLVPIQGPEGWQVGFRLEIDGDKNIPQCAVSGPLGQALYTVTGEHPETLVGKLATVAGLLYNVRRTDKPNSWYRLHVDRIETEDWILPSDEKPDDPPLEQPPEDVPLVGEGPALFDDAAVA